MSNLVIAVDALTAVTTLIVRGAQAQQHIADMIRRAQAEGRDLSSTEMAEIQAKHKAAMDRWDALA